MNKRQLVAQETQAGAIRLSQVENGTDPRESVGGVTFRHLSMLAQIKSSDEDVWSSLSRSGHIKGKPGSVLKIRLSRMRAWINGPHFPDESRIDIRSEISDESRSAMGKLGVLFLTNLSSFLSDCEWSEEGISAAISQACENTEIQRKDCYSAIYLALTGRTHGPKVSALLFEMERSTVISLFDCD